MEIGRNALWPMKKGYPPNLDRSEEIYRMFKPTDPYDREALDERIEALKAERGKAE